MTPVASADCGLSNTTRNDLQRQLYCYAEDLQELMQQQSALQQRNQIMLQALGRGDNSDDLLLGLLTRYISLYLVTDKRGVISFASPDAHHTLCQPGLALKGQSIQKLGPAQQHEAMQAVLDGFATDAADQAISLRHWVFYDGMAAETRLDFEVLVVPIKKRDRIEIFWLFVEPSELEPNALPVHQLFPDFDDSEEGLLIVNPAGNILAVNPACSKITGLSPAELRGQNPSRLRSGLQDANFYQAMWQQLVAQGSWSGELFNRRKNGQIYFEWLSIRAIKNSGADTMFYIGAFADMSPRENDHRQLAQLAFHDTLTGLPNRRLLDSCMAQMVMEAECKANTLAVLFLDLNYLRLVHEQLGHDQLDQLLLAVSAHLQAAVRRGDVVARVGDAEFVILLPAIEGPSVVEDIANYILFLLDAPIPVGRQTIALQVNIGCARFPLDGTDAATLLRCADEAMYAARQFDLRFCFFDHDQTGSQTEAELAQLTHR